MTIIIFSTHGFFDSLASCFPDMWMWKLWIYPYFGGNLNPIALSFYTYLLLSYMFFYIRKRKKVSAQVNPKRIPKKQITLEEYTEESIKRSQK